MREYFFPHFSPKCPLTREGDFPGCAFPLGGRWLWTEIRLKSGRMALSTKCPACHRPGSTPQQLEFADVRFQHGLPQKRFCFSAIFLQRNQEGERGEEVAYSGPRAVESLDSEVKADTESDLSSTSRFSELCLSPSGGQCACGQRAKLRFYRMSCRTCHTYTEERRGEGGQRSHRTQELMASL